MCNISLLVQKSFLQLIEGLIHKRLRQPMREDKRGKFKFEFPLE